MGRIGVAVLIVAMAGLGPGARAHAAPAPGDSYLEGYAGAVLEREFKVSPHAVTVRGGVLKIDAAQLAGVDRARLLSTLAALPGVARVEVREPAARPATPEAAPPGSPGLPTGLMPLGRLFQPLLADPRWPHFAAAYRYYLGDRDLKHVGAVSFGETIPLIRGDAFADSQWEAGIQASVFAVFEVDAPSRDLVNADYFASFFGAWRRGPLSALARVFHQSSHLGDEFLLRTRVQRVNLSYESGDLKLSYDLPWGLRLYGGGGYLFDQEPVNLKPWSAQGGVEFRSPWTLASGYVRPIAAVDVQTREENRWNADLSLRAGLQFESVRVLERNLQVMLEYFQGNSSDGQFYKDRVEYLGVGAHFHF
jgi:Protein of unknown function (DUF1207)